MNEAATKFFIGYIVLYEWLLGVFFSVGCFLSWREALRIENDIKAIDGSLCACVAITCIAAGWGLVTRKCWGWFLSLFVGLTIAAFGFEGIRQSMRDDPYARMEGGFLFGSGSILLAIAALGLLFLLLPVTRKFVFQAPVSPAANLPS